MIRHDRIKFDTKTTNTSYENGVVDVIIADGVNELANASHLATESHKRPYNSVEGNDREAFFGRKFTGWNDIVTATTEGWIEGVNTVNDMIKKIKKHKLPRVKKRQRVKVWDDEDGDEVDNDRLREGRKPFRTTERVQNLSAKGVVTLVSDMRANWTVSPEDILWRGASACVLMQLLENAGYRVEFWTASAGACAYVEPRSDSFVAACAKRPEQPMNLPQIVGAVSAWFYRGVSFYSVNLAQDLQPSDYAGRDRYNGVKSFCHLLTQDETVLAIENLWDEKSAIDFIGDACEAIDQEKLSVCKWAYSPIDTSTGIAISFDRFNGSLKADLAYGCVDGEKVVPQFNYGEKDEKRKRRKKWRSYQDRKSRRRRF